RKVRDADPVRASGETDITVEEMETTVADFYAAILNQQPSPGDLALDTDLEDIFRSRRKNGARPAAELLKEHRKSLVDKVTYWTGVQRPLVKKLVESIEGRVGELGLKADVRYEKACLTEITVYATALAMNYLTRGKFVQT